MKWFYLLMVPCYSCFAQLKTAEFVDLKRYQGTWYEIALLPNPFEKKCIQGAVANYTLRKDGTLKVVNSCLTARGGPQSTAIAWVVDKKSQSKLRVSFVPLFKYFKWFGGDYWILYIDPDYQFAVVGTPDLKYLWLLARTPKVSDTLYQKFIKIASERGFDTGKIKRW